MPRDPNRVKETDRLLIWAVDIELINGLHIGSTMIKKQGIYKKRLFLNQIFSRISIQEMRVNNL